MSKCKTAFVTLTALSILAVALPAWATQPQVDTGTLKYWKGNLPAKYIYSTFSGAGPDVNTGTLSYTEATTGLPVPYIYESFSGPAPVVMAWKTIRQHLGIGALAIPLDPTLQGIGSEAPIVENRRYGIQTILVDFDVAIMPVDGSLDTADVTVTDSLDIPYTPAAVALINGDQTLEISFDAGDLPDGERYTVDITGKFRTFPTGRYADEDTICQIRALEGDINGDGSVNLIDLAASKYANRTLLEESTAHMDMNLDGEINLIDAAFTRSRTNNVAP